MTTTVVKRKAPSVLNLFETWQHETKMTDDEVQSPAVDVGQGQGWLVK